MLKARIAVLVSGGGTNLQALIDAQKSGSLHDGRIELVLASKKDAYALTRAGENGIEAQAVCRRDFESQEAYEQEMARLIDERQIDLIILAGFMSILSGAFTSRYQGRIINVHPSLIPSFCGKGYYGLKVHEAALSYGVKVTGATVHYVNEVTDGGRIILQKAVEVQEGDTPKTLQRRVMEEAEWQLLPKAAQMICAEIVKDRQMRRKI